MSAYSETRIQYRLTGETLALMEEAADQFADDTTLVAAIGIWDEKLTAAAKRLISRGEAGKKSNSFLILRYSALFRWPRKA